MKRPRIPLRRIGIVAAALVLAAPVLYAIAANLLLSNQRLAHLLSADPNKLLLRYEGARTAWWGRVHVEGLDLRARDPHLEWQLHVDALDADISLFALLGKRLHVRRLHADGVSFRIRPRLDPQKMAPDRADCMPPIEGFARVPLLEPEEAGKTHGKGLTIEIEEIVAEHVREVWIDPVRVGGQLRVFGAFQVGPDKRIEVRPSAAVVDDASVTVCDDPIVTELNGAVDAVLESTDLAAVTGSEVLRSLTTHSGFQGKAGGPRFLRHFIGENAPVDLRAGEGTFAGNLVVERGLVRPGSHSRLELRPTTIAFEERTVATRATLDLGVAQDDAGTRALSTLVLEDVSLTARNEKRIVARAREMSCDAMAPGTDLARPPLEFRFDCRAPQARIEDLKGVIGIPGDDRFALEQVSATVAASTHGSADGMEATVEIDSKGSIVVEGARVRGGLGGRVRATMIFADQQIDFKGTALSLVDPAVASEGVTEGWRGELTFPQAKLLLSGPSFEAKMRTAASDGRPFLAFYSAMRGTSPAIRAALGIVPSFATQSMTKDLHGQSELTVSHGSFRVRGLSIDAASSAMRLNLEVKGKSRVGGMFLRAGPAEAGIAFDGEHTSLVLDDPSGWFEREVASRR